MVVLVAVSFAGGAGLATIAKPPTSSLPSAAAQPLPSVRSVQLDIRATDLHLAPGVVWHAWTFNGTVPGPPVTVTAGQRLEVKVTNGHSLVHSFHTHLAPYPLASDGSQINALTGVGAGAMIPPGGTYTYVYHPTVPGVYYYHCHSADGDRMISEHIDQGLYGLLIVEAPDEPPVRDEAVFMAERGFDYSGDDAPFYLMNGKGIPGGEHALEAIFAAKGLEGVKAEFGKTVPLLTGHVGEPVRLSVVNIGNQIHSFHMHGVNAVSVDLLPGRIHPANVVQLAPGGADRLLITPAEPGVWLFHCHVVQHADLGMIGVYVVDGGA